MVADRISHNLSLVVRFRDHFSGEPILQEVPARIAGSYALPVNVNGSTSRRQADGTYRFISLTGSEAEILWTEPFTRTHVGWTRWDAAGTVSLPRAFPADPIDVEVWPTPAAVAPAGATGVRGKLIGEAIEDQQIRIRRLGAAYDRMTRSDPSGEFLFLPPGRLATAANGRIPMQIEVTRPDGTAQNVIGGGYQPSGDGPDLTNENFSLIPGKVSRILFQLA